MAQIHLRRDRGVALVDDADYPRVFGIRWFRKEGYAVRNVTIDGKRTQQYLHHMILTPPDGYQVMFKDHNGLNCQRSNLEIRSIQDSRRVARPRKKSTSPYKGVSFNAGSAKWVANIRVNGRLHNLGYFDSEVEAAQSYDQAAQHYFGAAAYYNFPELLAA